VVIVRPRRARGEEIQSAGREPGRCCRLQEIASSELGIAMQLRLAAIT
jgi:hypothetical protein